MLMAMPYVIVATRVMVGKMNKPASTIFDIPFTSTHPEDSRDPYGHGDYGWRSTNENGLVMQLYIQSATRTNTNGSITVIHYPPGVWGPVSRRFHYLNQPNLFWEWTFNTNHELVEIKPSVRAASSY